MHEMQSIATDVPVPAACCVSPSVCAIQKRLNKSRSCLGVKTLGGPKNILWDVGPHTLRGKRRGVEENVTYHTVYKYACSNSFASRWHHI